MDEVLIAGQNGFIYIYSTSEQNQPQAGPINDLQILSI